MRARTLISATAVAVFAAALLVALPVPASAATFTVNSNLDIGDSNLSDGVCATVGGVCTLRAAVQQANKLADTDVINVPAMTITLGSELPITSSMEIRGAGARATLLTATSGHRNIWVTGGNVKISDLAIQDITTNAPYGAGIHQTGGNVSLTRIRVSNIRVTATVVMAYGPVLAENGVMTIADSEISGNTTSTTSNTVYGGGVTTANSINTSTSLRIVNSTIANNTAATSGSSFAMGGGIYAGSNHNVEVESSTIAGNSVSNGLYGIGGNIFSQTLAGDTGSFLVKDSILAGGIDSAAAGGNCLPAGSSGSRTITMTGRNLVDDSTCGAAATERTIGNARLRPLANNGGPTNTMPPAADSPALNAASGCASPADQRGQARPIGPACDLGSAELGAAVAVTAALSNSTPSPGADIILTAGVTNQGQDTATGTNVTVSVTGGELLPGGSCSATGNIATCPLPDLAGGSAGTVLLAARAPQSGTASFQVSVSAQQPDPNPADNTATVLATVPATTPPPPALTAPMGSVTLSSSIPVRWTSTGTATGFEVQRALKKPGRALGAYAAWRSLAATVPSTTMTGAAPGYGYCFRVRALGAGGTVSAWSAPKCTTMPSDDRALAGRTGWARSTVKTAYLRTVASSRLTGATLSLAASRGSALALVVTRVPGAGNIGVYVRGKRVAVVATAARRAAMKTIIVVKVRTAGYPLTLRVESPGTRGVTIDGIAQLP